MAKGPPVITAEFHGFKSLQKELRELPKKVEGQILRKVMRTATKTVAAHVAGTAPVDTGLLARSITTRALKRKKGRVGFRVAIKNVNKIVTVTKEGKRHFYPAVLEYGTSKQAAHPFIRPAFEATVDPVTKQIGEELGDRITKAAKVQGKA